LIQKWKKATEQPEAKKIMMKEKKYKRKNKISFLQLTELFFLKVAEDANFKP